MLTYIIRRLLLMIPTLIGITMVVFFTMAWSPGGVAGPLVKNEAGQGEMEAEKAKALRAYYNRRYGLDKPAMVQYLRWLNQVSPIGFRTSAQLTYSDEEIKAAEAVLVELGLADNRNERERSLMIAQTITSFETGDLVKTTRQVAVKLLQPIEALELYTRVGTEAPPALRSQVESLVAKDKPAAQLLVLNKLSEEMAGANRILFSRPALKWPDLGESIAKGRPVTALYGEALPVTLLLNFITTPIIYFIAIFTGVYAARHRGKLFDVVSGITLIALWSIPTIWAGVMLVGFFANDDYVRLFPAGGLSSTLSDQMAFLPSFSDDGFERGWLLDRMWHLVMPILCLTYGGFAFLSKIMRSALLENLSNDYVRTARAKGVQPNVVLWQHAFRNSLLPLITSAAHLLPALLVGSIVVEKIFSIPGMGKLTIDAIGSRDRELVLAGAFIGGILGMISVLIADLCYAFADPRVSFD